MSDDLLYEKKDGIATVTLNRPEARNALSPDMREGLFQSFIDAESDDTIRCVVVRGEGEHFQAGGDVKAFNGELEGETAKLAKRLANGPTVAIGRTKQLLNASLGNTLETQLSLEAQGFAFCAASDDWAEGVQAFKEKRKPDYKGK